MLVQLSPTEPLCSDRGTSPSQNTIIMVISCCFYHVAKPLHNAGKHKHVFFYHHLNAYPVSFLVTVNVETAKKKKKSAIATLVQSKPKKLEHNLLAGVYL